MPLIDGIEIKSFSIFFNEPEKLFQVAFSSNSFFTVDFDKQVKLPNLIDCPVNAKVKIYEIDNIIEKINLQIS